MILCVGTLVAFYLIFNVNPSAQHPMLGISEKSDAMLCPNHLQCDIATLPVNRKIKSIIYDNQNQ